MTDSNLINIETLLKLTSEKQTDIIRKISKEKQIELLSQLSNNKEIKEQNEKENKDFSLDRPFSSRPLWNEQANQMIRKVLGNSFELQDYDYINQSLTNLNGSNFLLDEFNMFVHDEYPFVSGIKRLLFAYGDYIEPSLVTIKYVHDIVNKWFILLLRILDKCDFQRIIFHLYSREVERFNKFKRNKYLFKEKKRREKMNGNHFKTKIENKENHENDDFLYNVNEDEAENEGEGEDEGEDQDEENVNEDESNEILLFENERAKQLSNEDYMNISEIKTLIIGGKSKRIFHSYLVHIMNKQNIVYNQDLKDQVKLDLLSFIIKRRIKTIILKTNKMKNNGKLKILMSPIQVEDIEEDMNEEITYLEEFLIDYNTSIYLVDAFSKRNSFKSSSKFLKIKRINEEIVIVIKKNVFLMMTKEENEEFKHVKDSSEYKITSFFKSNKYISYKEKEEIEGKEKSKSSRYKLFINKEKIVSGLPLSNYYEFFILDTFIYNFHSTCLETKAFQLNKAKIHLFDKKVFAEIYSKWTMRLSKIEREEIKNKFMMFVST